MPRHTPGTSLSFCTTQTPIVRTPCCCLYRRNGGRRRDRGGDKPWKRVGRPRANRNAIVSLCIGNDYVALWEHLCRHGWQTYADANHYDLIVISEPIDQSERGRSRSLAWQKLLVLDQDWAQKYQQIVWIDADIVIFVSFGQKPYIGCLHRQSSTTAKDLGACAGRG